MAIPPGTRLGPYEVVSAIGAGGMGEVYKAQDTRLNRTVAIKVLPANLAEKPGLRERFEREARTIAGLNHPHICTLHDVGHQDGTDYLVMEYLEGETLAQRLLKGPLPLDQALQYAIEIAAALDKAHRNGITHRDLKPGNILLTKTGAKLLDFGLAKLRQEAAPAASLSALPTVTKDAVTAEGTILGTLQYMAPEQVEGKTDEIDARTDIFAFGAVVYEMATGKKAFEGKTQASLIAKILETHPPPMSSLQPMTPPALDRVVQRCLAKEQDDRWQTANDLAQELKWVLDSGSLGGTPIGVPAAKPVLDRRQGALALGMAAVALLMLGSLVAWILMPAPARGPEMRLEIVTPPTSDPVSLALSPDGRQILFVASDGGPSRLWLRRMDATAAQPLAGTEGASFPFWAPDSRSAAFFADNKLKRIDIEGGLPQTLADTGASRGGTWNPEGIILFTPNTTSPLIRIPAAGGEQVAVTKLDRQTSHRFPQFLPGGREFLFYAMGTAETAGIYLGSLDSSETTHLVAADTAGAYSPNGWLLFIRGGTLLAQRLDLGRGELTGDPVTVADPVVFAANARAGGFSVSSGGLVAYRPGRTGQQLTWFDRSGNTLSVLAPPDPGGLAAPSLSPESGRAAAHRLVQGNADIWLFDAPRITRFTFDASLDRFPIWSPDGDGIVFDSNRTGRRDLYLKRSNGAGSAELLLESPQNKSASDWSRDGRFLLYNNTDSQGLWDIWVLPMEGSAPSTGSRGNGPAEGREPFAFLETDFDESQARFSPDGLWVAYQSNESGRYEVYVRPFRGRPSGTAASGQWQVSTSGGMSPRWRPDGEELYYIADNTVMAAPILVNGATLQPGLPVALFQARIHSGTDPTTGTQYDVSGDGRFLINTTLEDDASPITLLQNWIPGTER